MGIEPEREVEISLGQSKEIIWTDSEGKKRTLVVPPTVYPPREDTNMLHESLMQIKGIPGRLLEIGTGTGAIGISMAEIGWEVCGVDVNPLAIVAARGNHKTGNFVALEKNIEDIEAEENKSWDVITWNTPYLECPRDNRSRLGPFEEAALSWEGEHPIRLLLKLGSKPGILSNQGCIIALVSPSHRTNRELGIAISEGWSVRPIQTRCNGGERTTVIALWRGWEWDPIIKNSISSTMELLEQNTPAGKCAIAIEQTNGYGRNNSNWISLEGDITATWRICGPNPPKFSVQEMHMAASLAVHGAICTWNNITPQFTTWSKEENSQYTIKWPNDIYSRAGNEKVAGILLHAESKGEKAWISCGVGVNGIDRKIDGNEIKGISKSGLEGLEIHLHRHFSSWFEEHQRIPIVDTKFLRKRWWSAASKTQIIGSKGKANDETGIISKISDSGLEIVTRSAIKQISELEMII